MQMLPEAPRQRVLIVEDDPTVLELVITRLSIAGYETFHARDGHEGLKRVKDVSPCAMILDINMPRLDGFGVLETLGMLGILARLPTMVLTARNQAEDVQKALKLGARDFLSKPFKDRQLLARVARLVNGNARDARANLKTVLI